MLYLFKEKQVDRTYIEQFIEKVHLELGTNSKTKENLSKAILSNPPKWLKEISNNNNNNRNNKSNNRNIKRFLNTNFKDIDPLIGTLRIGKFEQNQSTLQRTLKISVSIIH